MSRSTIYTLTCPCGITFSGVTYEYVNVAQDPQLRYTVLSGSLNVSTCPNCGRRAAISNPFIYSDPEHNLLAYVHPRSDAPEEARMLVLEQLRSVYVNLADEQQEYVEGRSEQKTLQAEQLPPLQVIFGLEQLNEVINAVLSPDERLGRLALSTQSRNEAERGQFLDIARKLASEMACGVQVEDFPDEYTVWVFGARRQIGALMRELTPRG